jgi:hypothetical protein
MRTRFAPVRILGPIALTLAFAACTSSSGSDHTGTAGTSSTAGSSGPGAAGTNGQGTSGTNGQGTAGSTQGTAGSNQGTAGDQGTAGATQGTAGASGSGPGTAGAGGTGGSGTAGTGGAGGTSPGTGGTGAAIPTPGCGMPPASTDSATKFNQKVIMVTGVDPAFVAKYPVNGGSQFNWTKRNYYVRLPSGYSPDKAYPVDLEGTGCAGGETTGSSGEYSLPAMTGQTEAIQIGLSYVTSSAANPSCIAFTDDYVNTPEVQYINAVIDDVSAHYCADKNRFFINGYSSGAFESSMAGGANADKLRAIGLQIGGGMRMKHPPYSTHPIAAMFVVGLLDQGNPIGPLATPLNDTIGSVAARDEILVRNGCVPAGTPIVDTCAHGAMVAANETNPLPCTAGVADGDTYGSAPHTMWDAAYPKCQMYTGCPAKYPVVWCPLLVNHGNGPNPMGADGTMVENYRRTGMWKFFSSLPEP